MVGGFRGRISDGQLRYSQRPLPADHTIVRALLEAWQRNVSDRYLDFIQVLRHAAHVSSPDTPWHQQSLHSITTIEEAHAQVRANAPSGCVKFALNELCGSTLPLFGENIPHNLTFNQYYTALLTWDDFHLSGLIGHITQEQNRNSMIGDVPLNLVLQAALDWIAHYQRDPDSVYHALRVQG